jgi:RHS repeat-associated protein
VSECFGSPGAACKRQFDAYAWPGATFNGYEEGVKWYVKKCSWNRNSNFGPFPATVSYSCKSGYVFLPGGTCVKQGESLAIFSDDGSAKDTCDNTAGASGYAYNNGSSRGFRSDNPIDILTGAKLFRTVDFKTADSSLLLERIYNTRRYSGSYFYDQTVGAPVGLGKYWKFWFQHEILFNKSFPYKLEVDLGDGLTLPFQRASSGAMIPHAWWPAGPKNQTGYRLELVGSWPANPSDIQLSSSQWKFYDPQDRVWTFQTFLDPYNGKYLQGRPISVTFRGGLQWTFIYGTHNELTSIQDSYGKTISFTWTLLPAGGGTATPGVVTSAALPDGTVLKYLYDALSGGVTAFDDSDRLTDVEHRDASNNLLDKTTYLYENANLPLHVTGVLDVNGTRRWTVVYDTEGHATESNGPGDFQKTTVSYSPAASPSFTRTVTNAAGKSGTFTYKWASTDIKVLSYSGAASANCPSSNPTYAYNTSSFLSSIADEEGRVTNYTRNALGQATQIINGYGTPSAKTTNITWHSTLHVPIQVVQPGLTTDYTWNASGQLTQVTQTDTTTTSVPYSTNGQTRTWAYTYNTYGYLLTVDGPLTGTGDTVTYTYDTAGYLASITNEVGQVLTVSAVNGRGEPTTVVDAGGITNDLTYDSEGRLKTIAVDPSGLNAVTAIDYNAMGDVTKITRPNGAYLQYTYDDARRIIKVEDNSSDYFEFDRDNLGNVTARRARTSGGTLKLTQTATFDELGRLLTSVGNASQTWTHAYDKTNNRVSVTDPRSHVFHWAFDSVNRLISTTDEDSGVVTLTRDGQDQVTNHSDPRSLSTSYARDGFGDIIQRSSPDSGTTVYVYNALGKPTQVTDGRGIVTNLTYDNAGRLLTKQYPAATSENITCTWDSTTSGNNGAGRITKIEDASGSVEWFYNALGQVTQEKKTTASIVYTVDYTYDLDGKVTQITYPSGRIVNISRDSAGRMSSITTKKDSGSASVTLASSVAYLPLGPLMALTYGNGLTLSKIYTQDYLIGGLQVQDSSTSTVVLDRSYAFGDAINLTGISDNLTPARDETYTYTNANRLQQGDGIWGTLTWAYDATGNRISEVLTAGSTTTSTYNYPGTNNKLLSITQGASTVRAFSYDGAGNISADTRGSTAYNYHYNNRNRLDQLTIGATVTADYVYDGLERLAIRTTQNMTPAGTTHYVYDRAGHLIAEATNTGTTTREYIWFDDMPLAAVADVDTASPNLYYVHTDHLDRPLKMTDGSQVVVWDAVYNPFGDVNSITGSASNNLRFPGQYFLIESGLHYNWHRHYDPTLGRYTQTDPLGFIDGPSIYAYAKSAPSDNIDRNGHQSDTPWPDRRYTPLPPGIFDEWNKNADKSVNDIWNFCRRIISGAGGEDRNGPGCKEEWAEARRDCEKELSKPYPNRGFTGGHRSVEDCARGLVSARCGGNGV